MKYYDKNQTEINIGDIITNSKEERENHELLEQK